MTGKRDAATTPSDSSESRQSELDANELAALVAHEFRGPVHALQAYLSVLLRGRAGPLTDIQQDFLASMQSVTRRLERLANDIQVLSSVQRQFSIVPQPVNALELADSCRWELTPLAEDFQVGLEVVAPDRARAGDWVVAADPVRLEQVLLNLMENAIRYSPAGSTVRLWLRQSSSRLLLTVENAVDATHAPEPELLLAPFQRGAASASRHPQGSGLGLYVVTTLVAAHHGRLLTRVRGQQVRIAICLPRNRQPDMAQEG